jgi:hypothetical protein
MKRSEKIAALRGNVVKDAFKFVGGAPQPTKYKNASGASGTDSIDFETQTAGQTVDGGGGVDYSRD